MMHDDPLIRRYSDLVPSSGALPQDASDANGADDTNLRHLLADLEGVYASDEPPPMLGERIATSLQARADQLRQSSAPSPSTISARRGTAPAVPPVPPRRSRQGSASMNPMNSVSTATLARRKRLSTIAACAAALIVVALIGVLLYSMRGAGGVGSGGDFQERFQRQGGVQVVLAGDCAPGITVCPPNAQADIPILLHRLDGMVSADDRQMYATNTGYLVLEIAGQQDENRFLPLLSSGELDIINTGNIQLTVGTDVRAQICQSKCSGGQYRIAFTGADLDPNSISAALDPQTNQPIVTFAFQGAARTRFAEYTRNNIGNYLTITLDGKVIESATIQSEVDGAGQISGIPTLTDARNLATLLKDGALPVPLRIVSITVVKPGTPAPNMSCYAPTPTATPLPPAPTATASSPVPSATATPFFSATPVFVPTDSGGPTPTPYNNSATCPTPTAPPTPTGQVIPTASPGGPAFGTPTATPPTTPTPTPGQ